jgi:cysteine desulfurase / selenocysteine lyase
MNSKIKSNFPIFDNHPDLVYLDNGATTQKPQSVIDAISNYYENSNANVHRGIYDLSEESTEIYEMSRDVVARFINAQSSKEVIFTGGTTDSINFVGYSWVWQNVFEGDTMLTTQMEHHANIIIWQQIAKYRTGVKLEYVSVKSNFELDLVDLEKKLSELKPKLLAITHVSNVLGTINPIKEIVEIKNRVSPDTRIFVDGAQAIAHIPVDVQELGVDFYVFSGHKMYAPMGTGVLWAKQEILEKEMSPFRFGGGMIVNVERDDSEWAELPDKFEGGTPNVAGAVGMVEAIRFILSIGWDKIINHEQELTRYALEKLSQMDNIKVFGPEAVESRIGVISFEIQDIHPHDIASILAENGVAVRAGHHCAHILARECLKTMATTRASLGVYNTKEDVERFDSGIKKVIKLFS